MPGSFEKMRARSSFVERALFRLGVCDAKVWQAMRYFKPRLCSKASALGSLPRNFL